MAATAPVFTGTPAQAVRRTVTAVVFTIAGLAFTFGFGNGWTLGVRLGVPTWIAPLIAPAVDLSVIALLAAVQFLRAHGVPGRLIGPRLLLVACGGITFALNTASPVLGRQYGRACFDAVAPLLLIGWSEVGPRLLALLHATVPVPDDRPAVPDQASVPAGDPEPNPVPDRPAPVPAEDEDQDRPGPPADLIAAARQIATDHLQATGQPITRDTLRARLRVSNHLASQLLHHLRTT